jgi:hypothetical protein
MAAPRPAKDLKFTDPRAKLLREAKQEKTKRLADEMRKKARQQAADKKPRPAKDIQKGDMRSQFLKQAKADAKTRARDLAKTKAAAVVKPQASSVKLGDVARGVAARTLGAAGFYFGDTFGKGDLNRGEREFIAREKAAWKAKQSRTGMNSPTPANSGAPAKIRKDEPRMAAGTITGPYDQKRKAAGTYTAPYEPKRGAAGTYTKPYDEKRSAAGTYTKPYDKKPASAASGAPPKPKQKPASDKSSQSGKMTSFQRMKARQFEKEGVAGRSMSRSAAQKKAVEMPGSRKPSLFGTKKAEKPAGKSKSERAAAFRALMQGRAK